MSCLCLKAFMFAAYEENWYHQSVKKPDMNSTALRVPQSDQETQSLDQILRGLTTGNLEIRVTTDADDILASQALRYRVFYEEMAARPTAEMLAEKRDFDAFDAVADHLQVVDHDLGDGPEAVIGTYRLTRRDAAERIGQFYTVDEYDIDPILNLPGEILELGRSCVDEPYRTRRVMDLLWRGIAAYVFHYDIQLMFGCASFQGNDVNELALPLSYLHHYHLAPKELRSRALPSRYHSMNLIQKDDFNPKEALSSIPPLIKGYLRLGGFVGDGAVVDPQFNTVDICIIVKTDLITDRYSKHYARKHAEG